MDVRSVDITAHVNALSLSTERYCGGPVIVNIQCINASDTARAVLSFVGIAKTKLVCSHVAKIMYLKPSNPSGIYVRVHAIV